MFLSSILRRKSRASCCARNHHGSEMAMKVAVIGSGIVGLAAAHRLRGRARVMLFEAGQYFGGHTHTVDVSLPDAHGQTVTHGVDTGFLVFNDAPTPA